MPKQSVKTCTELDVDDEILNLDVGTDTELKRSGSQSSISTVSSLITSDEVSFPNVQLAKNEVIALLKDVLRINFCSLVTIALQSESSGCVTIRCVYGLE